MLSLLSYWLTSETKRWNLWLACISHPWIIPKTFHLATSIHPTFPTLLPHYPPTFPTFLTLPPHYPPTFPTFLTLPANYPHTYSHLFHLPSTLTSNLSTFPAHYSCTFPPSQLITLPATNKSLHYNRPSVSPQIIIWLKVCNIRILKQAYIPLPRNYLGPLDLRPDLLSIISIRHVRCN